jgi:uncharacterized protein (DUF1697 family)
MTTYVALLRGINVSGQKIIKMDALRKIFESLHFQDVKTYIQSGNVIFKTPEEDRESLVHRIEEELKRTLGYEVTVILRMVAELAEVVRQNPFASAIASENEKVYITFLAKQPSAEAIQKLESFKNDIDDFCVVNREVFLLCRQSYGRSKFSNNFFEKILGVSATTRNLETVNKIISMATR